mmetsp:Transcript_17329/g.19311  ORF Transcript_17329/g.19311 Transcript_17329/m.19311 type:complete len:152 (-) Transcript_17329:69-524(-)|eukprot:CAMPEP_0168532322 /NCGR_PEP_ID=MMETSP0405-20121227/16146_1 /TAXON_ID=498012 /ORGANISM="Trichosphaerium sp, Strain Am-I-7 wt" /LENGTH=151 /DNA_ID=CAMNT_0008557637 /DNA_START=13 /DNA_END=468 /DNA_ORIENTATION=-
MKLFQRFTAINTARTAAVHRPSVQTRTFKTSAVLNEQGTIKWFNVRKGYGFVKRDDQQDTFVHFQDAQEGRDAPCLVEGDIIEFDIRELKKGPSAANWRIITPNPLIPRPNREPRTEREPRGYNDRRNNRDHDDMGENMDDMGDNMGDERM